MKNLSRLAASLGILATMSVGASALVAGCGGDDTSVGDAGTDATVDAPGDTSPSPDHSVPDTSADTSTDTNVPDTTVPDANDGGGNDAADAHDALDAADAADTLDAADAADTLDAADSADTLDAAYSQDGQAVLDFLNQAASAFCTAYGSCCLANADAGGQTFSQATCLSRLGPGGTLGLNFYGNLWVAHTYANRGNIQINAAAAQACLADLQTYSCTGVTSAWLNKANTDCAAALQGVLPSGLTNCQNYFECSGAQTCTGGTCTALSGAGGTCANGQNNECETHGFGPQGLWCGPADGGKTCQAKAAEDAGCIDFTHQCVTGICSSVCVSSESFSQPSVQSSCNPYFTP